MKTAHSLPLNGNATGQLTTTSASRTSGAKKTSSKRKAATVANEDDSEGDGSPKKCKIDDLVKKENQEDD